MTNQDSWPQGEEWWQSSFDDSSEPEEVWPFDVPPDKVSFEDLMGFCGVTDEDTSFDKMQELARQMYDEYMAGFVETELPTGPFVFPCFRTSMFSEPTAGKYLCALIEDGHTVMKQAQDVFHIKDFDVCVYHGEPEELYCKPKEATLHADRSIQITNIPDKRYDGVLFWRMKDGLPSWWVPTGPLRGGGASITIDWSESGILTIET